MPDFEESAIPIPKINPNNFNNYVNNYFDNDTTTSRERVLDFLYELAVDPLLRALFIALIKDTNMTMNFTVDISEFVDDLITNEQYIDIPNDSYNIFVYNETATESPFFLAYFNEAVLIECQFDDITDTYPDGFFVMAYDELLEGYFDCLIHLIPTPNPDPIMWQVVIPSRGTLSSEFVLPE